MSAPSVSDLLGDPIACHRIVSSRDARWDGRLFLGVVTTGVYCRPSCAARTPRPENCRYYPSSSAAVAAGFRACRRCRPDRLGVPKSGETRSDLAARALALIRDGVADDGGVAGLASRLHVSERHLHRVLVAEVGAGPLRLASSRRAQIARLLVEQSRLNMAQVAFAAGFTSIRQFNDVMRAEFGCSPSDLRGRSRLSDRQPVSGGPGLVLRLPYREPYAAAPVWGFLAARAVPGVETVDVSPGEVTRLVRTPSGTCRVTVTRPDGGLVRASLELAELADLGPVVAALRRWLDLDADPTAVDAVLSADPHLRRPVARAPGMRVPGTVDGFELALRAVVGQQVSVGAARTLLGRLAAAAGPPGLLPGADDVLAIGEPGLRGAGLTGSRAATLLALAQHSASGRLVLDAGADQDETRRRLLEIRGVGEWTADYIALRALGDPDAWPGTDLVLRRSVDARGLDPGRWRPWRGYAAMHLWTRTSDEEPR